MGAALALLGGPVWGFIRAFWKPLAIALAALLIVGFIHHKGYKSGVANTEGKYLPQIAKLKAEAASATAALAETEAAYKALQAEDIRIKQQQQIASVAAQVIEKKKQARLAKIRAQKPAGATEEERLRDLIRKQAQ